MSESGPTRSSDSRSERTDLTSKISDSIAPKPRRKMTKTNSAPESKIIAVYREQNSRSSSYSKRSLNKNSRNFAEMEFPESESIDSKTSLKTYIMADEAKTYMKSLVRDCVKEMFSGSNASESELFETEKEIYLRSLHDDVVRSGMTGMAEIKMEDLLKTYVGRWLDDVVQTVEPGMGVGGEEMEVKAEGKLFHNSLRKLTSSSVKNFSRLGASSKDKFG